MESGMRICKECGKLFKPKGREQYCPEVHYRPCPVCGKPVEAKYLSDPARCCSKECQALARSKKSTPSINTTTKITYGSPNSPQLSVSNELPLTAGEVARKYSEWLSDNLDTGRVFAGPDGLLGFISGHRYKIDISKRPNEAYQVSAYHDMTSGKAVDLYVQLSSMVSIMKYFRKDT